jgi:hypothetical protein
MRDFQPRKRCRQTHANAVGSLTQLHGSGALISLRAFGDTVLNMTLDDFRQSLTSAEPPTELTFALLGLRWDAKGDWKRAHESAQQDEGKADGSNACQSTTARNG